MSIRQASTNTCAVQTAATPCLRAWEALRTSGFGGEPVEQVSSIHRFRPRLDLGAMGVVALTIGVGRLGTPFRDLGVQRCDSDFESLGFQFTALSSPTMAGASGSSRMRRAGPGSRSSCPCCGGAPPRCPPRRWAWRAGRRPGPGLGARPHHGRRAHPDRRRRAGHPDDAPGRARGRGLSGDRGGHRRRGAAAPRRRGAGPRLPRHLDAGAWTASRRWPRSSGCGRSSRW